MVWQPWDDIQWCGSVYGNPGLGKTFFAAGLPKPMKVFMFDPAAKGLAYLQQGAVTPIEWMPDGGGFQFVRDRETGEVLVELEYFMDRDPTRLAQQKFPCAYERFQASLVGHMDDHWKGFRSVVLDSYTFCELACARLVKYKLNPAPGGVEDSKHNQQQWGGQVRGIIQTDIISVFPWVDCHACVLAHVDDKRYDEQDKQIWGISAVGKLGALLPSAFGEVYFMYREYDERTKRYQTWMMTESDGHYIAQTHIGAQNPCKPTWEGVWEHRNR